MTTLIVDKIGKDQAENDYFIKVVPMLKVRFLVAQQLWLSTDVLS